MVRALDRTLIVVADGAGGVAGGAAAAESICSALHDDRHDWSTWLSDQDARLAERGAGQAAAVVVSISHSGNISGASVGDCEAWLFGQGEPRALTAAQVRKPLLGDGAAVPATFTGTLVEGTLIIATDGLWKYTSRARIAPLAAIRPLETALAALVAAVTLNNGEIQDDLAIVICATSST